MYVRVLQNVLCWERICRGISSFADASQVLIPMDGILHVQLKNKHSAFSKHPMVGILRALWQRCHPMDGKMETTSSAFMDQPRLCHRKHHSLQFHPCFRASINLQPRIRRPRCYSSRANGTPVAPGIDSKRHVLLPQLPASDPSANFFARPFTRPFPFRLDFDLWQTFADPPRAFFSSADSQQYNPFGRLQHSLSFQNFFRETTTPPL